jgi:hypothetical protein
VKDARAFLRRSAKVTAAEKDLDGAIKQSARTYGLLVTYSALKMHLLFIEMSTVGEQEFDDARKEIEERVAMHAAFRAERRSEPR